MSTDNTYNKLLSKLSDGTISNGEKWELERASLDDPFLAEALEGYYDNESSALAIPRLQKRIIPSNKKSKTIGLRWLSIAASLLVLLSVSFWLFDSSDAELMHSKEAAVAEVDLDIEASDTRKLPDNLDLEQNAEKLIKKTISKAPSLPTSALPEPIKKAGAVATGVASKAVSQKANSRAPKNDNLESDSNANSRSNSVATNKQMTTARLKNESTESKRREINSNWNKGDKITDDYMTDATEVKTQAPEEIVTADLVKSKEKKPRINENLNEDLYSQSTGNVIRANSGPIIAPPSIISGVIKNESGRPMPGVQLLDTKNNEVATTDDKGSFVLPELDGYLVTAFAGYDSLTVAISPELDIVLRESSKTLSEPIKRLVDQMDDTELIFHYKNKLNSLYSKNWPLCPTGWNQAINTSSSLSIAIEILPNGQVVISHIFGEISDNCQGKISEIMEQAEEEIFKPNRPISFNFRINL